MAPPTAKNANNQTSYGVLKANSLPRRAYVTFLAGNGDYWKGVVGLAKSLRKAQSVYPLVVAVLPDVPLHHRNMLLSQGCIIREIEHVYPPENPSGFVRAGISCIPVHDKTRHDKTRYTKSHTRTRHDNLSCPFF
ncbi:putative inositol 3-alpha-galactosyltransferase [Helianthus debilis subsp. tardiflorus]